jgi:hypothetical protein
MSKQGRLWAAKCRVTPREAAKDFRRYLDQEGSVIAAAGAMGLTRSTIYYLAREVPEIGAEIDRLRDRQEKAR